MRFIETRIKVDNWRRPTESNRAQPDLESSSPPWNIGPQLLQRRESNPRPIGTADCSTLQRSRHSPITTATRLVIALSQCLDRWPVVRTGSGPRWADLCVVSTLLCVSTALPLDFPTDTTGWTLFSRLNDASGNFRPLRGCPGHDSRFPAHLCFAGSHRDLSSLHTPISRHPLDRPMPMRLKCCRLRLRRGAGYRS